MRSLEKGIQNGLTISPYNTSVDYLDDILDEEDRLIVLDPFIAAQRLEKQHGGFIEVWEDGELVKDFMIQPLHIKDNEAIKQLMKTYFAGSAIHA